MCARSGPSPARDRPAEPMTERGWALNVEDTGNRNGPPALLLHGFMSSNLQWELNRERLGAELRLLLTEQPGHGRSPVPMKWPPTGPMPCSISSNASATPETSSGGG
jgi:pimeloyl-ACP methyl ester carboxylesterase